MMSSQPDCETSINPLLQYEGTFILRTNNIFLTNNDRISLFLSLYWVNFTSDQSQRSFLGAGVYEL